VPSTTCVAPFVDPATIPACGLLEESVDLVASELAEVGADEWAPWFQADAYRGKWEIFGLFHRGEHPMLAHLHEVLRRDRCPRTRAMLSRIPGLITAAFSALEPGTHVYAHADDTPIPSLRIHLPIVVDPGAKLRVEQVMCGWERGRCLCFETFRVHEAVHEGRARRVLLLLEIERSRSQEPVLPAPPR
jgi:beta-hydroxylase